MKGFAVKDGKRVGFGKLEGKVVRSKSSTS